MGVMILKCRPCANWFIKRIPDTQIFGPEKKQKEEKNSILLAMLARNFLCLFLILCGGVLSAQEIHFHVVEKDKEEAIPGALIVFNDTEHQVTDWKGEAIVKAKGSSSISVRMMGYQEISWSPAQWMPLLQKGADGKYDCIVVLSPIANESSTLVVSSSLYGRSIRENSQSIERIDGRDILRKRTADLSGALERVPGVTIVDGLGSIVTGKQIGRAHV